MVCKTKFAFVAQFFSKSQAFSSYSKKLFSFKDTMKAFYDFRNL